MIVAAWALIALGTLFLPTGQGNGAEMTVMAGVGMVFAFLIKALLAVQSCRFFAEARRDGLLELLLYTPLTSREIIDGQSQAFQKVMLAPVASFLGLLYVPGLIRLLWTLAIGARPSWDLIGPLWAVGGGLTLSLLLDLLAIRWFGMWLSLKVKNPTYATGLTILFVVILPSTGCAVCCVFTLLSDLVLFLVGYTQCQQDLRRSLARQSGIT